MNFFKKILFTFLAIFFLSSLTKNLIEYRKNLSFYENYKKEYEAEKKQNIALKTQALKKSDPNEVEKIIRNKLNLAKPNEITIMLPDPTPSPLPSPTIIVPVYQQWAEVFFKN